MAAGAHRHPEPLERRHVADRVGVATLREHHMRAFRGEGLGRRPSGDARADHDRVPPVSALTRDHPAR